MPPLKRRLPNAWEPDDDRFEGLLPIANAINTVIDIAHGQTDVVAESEFEPEYYPYWSPLRLADRLREALHHIEESTVPPHAP